MCLYTQITHTNRKTTESIPNGTPSVAVVMWLR